MKLQMGFTTLILGLVLLGPAAHATKRTVGDNCINAFNMLKIATNNWCQAAPACPDGSGQVQCAQEVTQSFITICVPQDGNETAACGRRFKQAASDLETRIKAGDPTASDELTTLTDLLMKFNDDLHKKYCDKSPHYQVAACQNIKLAATSVKSIHDSVGGTATAQTHSASNGSGATTAPAEGDSQTAATTTASGAPKAGAPAPLVTPASAGSAPQTEAAHTNSASDGCGPMKGPASDYKGPWECRPCDATGTTFRCNTPEGFKKAASKATPATGDCMTRYQKLGALACVACGLEKANPGDFPPGQSQSVDKWVALLGIMAQTYHGGYNTKVDEVKKDFAQRVAEMAATYGYCTNRDYRPEPGAVRCEEATQTWLNKPNSLSSDPNANGPAEKQFAACYGLNVDNKHPMAYVNQIFHSDSEYAGLGEERLRYRTWMYLQKQNFPTKSFGRCASSIELQMATKFKMCEIDPRTAKPPTTMASSEIMQNNALYSAMAQSCGITNQRKITNYKCPSECPRTQLDYNNSEVRAELCNVSEKPRALGNGVAKVKGGGDGGHTPGGETNGAHTPTGGEATRGGDTPGGGSQGDPHGGGNGKTGK